jgi:hypothetical protein
LLPYRATESSHYQRPTNAQLHKRNAAPGKGAALQTPRKILMTVAFTTERFGAQEIFNPERTTETLSIVADEMESLRKRIASVLLRFEMIGIDDAEIDDLKFDVREFKRLCECLAWRPAQ